jgi:hypothetical protein
MADAGLVLRGAHGFVQIDHNWLNLHLVAQGDETDFEAISIPSGAARLYDVEIPLSADAIVACHSPTTPCTVYRQGPLFTDAGKSGFSILATNAASPEIKWFAFDKISAPSDAAVGLRVYRQPGDELVFDSGYPPMNVVHAQTMIAAASGTSGVSVVPSNFSGVTVPSGRTWAWAQCSNAKTQWSSIGGGPGGEPNHFLQGLTHGGHDGNSLVYSMVETLTVPGAENVFRQQPGFAIFIDVTEFL